MMLENANETTQIVINYSVLRSNVKLDGKTINFVIPKEPYTMPGHYKIFLLDYLSEDSQARHILC
jgi:hypothetical protein